MKYFLLAFFGIILTHCSAQKNDQTHFIKDYFFPYQNFKKTHTYYYVNTKDTTDKSTWIMQSKVQDGDTLFITQILNSQNLVQESLVEKMTNNIAQLISHKDYRYTSDKKPIDIDCSIIDSVVFKWNQRLNDSIFWRVHYQSNVSNDTMEFSKSRTLLEIDSTKNTAIFMDNFYSGLSGTDRQIIPSKGSGLSRSYKWWAIFNYKKDIGLINYYVNWYGEVIEYKLINISTQ